jgi:serine phosphatase RsbU (regulator of sigma subunit)
VKGKGLDAVELAAVVLATFRQTVFGYDDLAEVARALDDQVGTAATDEDFVTALLVDIPDEGPARIANCGHHPPLLMRSGRATYVQTDAAVPLGLGAAPHVHSFEFHPGDRMLLYTDGLLEARSADGSFFPFESHAVGTLSQGQLNVALSDLVAHVLVHVDGRLNDDLAVMIVELLGTAQAAAVS